MQSFQWDEHYETGIKEVDDQHHRLVDIINRLATSFSKKQVTTQEIDTIIQELMDYAQYHFSEEEQMMFGKNIDKRHCDSHTRAHAVFINKIMTLGFSSFEKNEKLQQDLLDFLMHWLAYHILVTDHNMANQISAVGKGMSVEEAYEQFESPVSRSVEPLLGALNSLFSELTLCNEALIHENSALKEELLALKNK